MYGDPKRLYALAAEIERREDDLRHRLAVLRDTMHRTEWASVAAVKHRARLGEDLEAIAQCADRLSNAAAELRAHADTVAARLAAIAEAERKVRDWFERAAGSLKADVANVIDRVGDAFDAITPWDGWPWQPDNLPPTGHVAWLDAARLVGGSRWQP